MEIDAPLDAKRWWRSFECARFCNVKSTYSNPEQQANIAHSIQQVVRLNFPLNTLEVAE